MAKIADRYGRQFTVKRYYNFRANRFRNELLSKLKIDRPIVEISDIPFNEEVLHAIMQGPDVYVLNRVSPLSHVNIKWDFFSLSRELYNKTYGCAKGASNG